MRTGLDARFWLPATLMGLVAAAVGVRLVRLHLNLVKVPETGYTFRRVTQGMRGGIYTADGTAVAMSRVTWEYHVDARTAARDAAENRKGEGNKKRYEHVKTISEKLGIPLPEVMEAYVKTNSAYVYLKTDGEQETYDYFTDPNTRVHELSITEKVVRAHPQGNRLSHVTGFVTRDPTNPVGAAGIEQQYEKLLKGRPGEIRGVRDALGRDVYNRSLQVDAIPGCDVHLTVDYGLQHETERALMDGVTAHGAERAWAVMLDVKRGAVLAMATYPDYSPDEFNKTSPNVRMNRVISESYEPGSVMKTITACAAIDEGMVGPETLISSDRGDKRYYRLPGDAGHRWDAYMTVRYALVHSSNIAFGKIGFDLGPKRLWGYFKKFGLGDKTGIELPGEEYGIVPHWKKWDKVKWSRAPIGQGVAVTAIQMAAAYAAIGNGGVLLKPYIVEKVVQADGSIVIEHKQGEGKRVIKEETARKVLAMMTGVAKRGGTARRAAIKGYSVAGKTGTAQMKDGRGYSNTDYNASFIGIVPATRPEIALLVTYQRPRYCRSLAVSKAEGIPLYNHQGGICAAPTFRRIAEFAMRRLEVEPDIPEDIEEDEEE